MKRFLFSILTTLACSYSWADSPPRQYLPPLEIADEVMACNDPIVGNETQSEQQTSYNQDSCGCEFKYTWRGGIFRKKKEAKAGAYIGERHRRYWRSRNLRDGKFVCEGECDKDKKKCYSPKKHCKQVNYTGYAWSGCVCRTKKDGLASVLPEGSENN